MIHCFSIRFRILASIAVVAVMLCYSPIFVTVHADKRTFSNGWYCKTTTPERTNDLTECFKNANGGAGCTGTIRVYAKIGKCTKISGWNPGTWFCSGSCTEEEVSEYEEFQVVPKSTWMGQLACLRSLGLGTLGTACVVAVLTGNVGAAIVTAGVAETAAGPISAGVFTLCGAGAAAAFNNWLNNPCCHTYCIKATEEGEPKGKTVTTCE